MDSGGNLMRIYQIILQLPAPEAPLKTHIVSPIVSPELGHKDLQQLFAIPALLCASLELVAVGSGVAKT